MGFVTTLSATRQAPPWVIDPRFPLFQQALPAAKASHRALAELLGDPQLVRQRDPVPDDFDDDRIDLIARMWAAFNAQYTQLATDKTFDKYASRLHEVIARTTDREPPEAILPPYFAADGRSDRWWHRSKDLFAATAVAAGDTTCLRVVCAKHVGAFDELLDDVSADEDVVVWVSGLEETAASVAELRAYRHAVENARRRGQGTFALYGGFFSVLLGSAGLCGSAHGVGFSEHRNWVQLPESGAPPARYYLRRAHRFVSPDLAQQLHDEDPSITACSCAHCGGRPPIQLEYHDLMKHSVACRAEEIRLWYGQPLAEVVRLLQDEHASLAEQIQQISLAPAIRNRALQYIDQLQTWADALQNPQQP